MNEGYLYLGLSVIASTCIVLIFKLFSKYNINILQAILVNYLVCVITGGFVLGEFPIEAGFWQEKWFPYALVIGVMFITGFNVLAYTVRYYGASVTSVVQKMSLIVTVCFAFWFYGESADWVKILGIVVALAAVVLTNITDKKNLEAAVPKKYLGYIVFTFFVSAAIEIVLQYVQREYLSTEGDGGTTLTSQIRFIVFLFGTACLLGTIYLMILLSTKKTKLYSSSVLAGIVLGVPNYFSIHYLLLSLEYLKEGSFVFPVNNVAIIAITVVVSWLVFKERLSALNWLGVFLAIISILLIGFSRDIIAW